MTTDQIAEKARVVFDHATALREIDGLPNIADEIAHVIQVEAVKILDAVLAATEPAR